MYGRYTKDLGEYAKNEARKLKMLERRRKKEDKARDKVSTTVFKKSLMVVQTFFNRDVRMTTFNRSRKTFDNLNALL